MADIDISQWAWECEIQNTDFAKLQKFVDRIRSDAFRDGFSSATRIYMRQPLTEEQVIQMALDAGFERNSLDWTFTYGRLDYQLTKFARAIEQAHRIGGEE